MTKLSPLHPVPAQPDIRRRRWWLYAFAMGFTLWIAMLWAYAKWRAGV